MRFLLVNGYNSTTINARLFDQFRIQVQRIIQKLPELADTDCEYYLRDRNQLDDFLYEPETSLIRMDYGLKFDGLDMIFIIASANTKPWNPNMNKIITLIRMCIKTKKLLFLTSFGTQSLAYLCASNIYVHINITNNNGDGCKLVEFPKYTNKAWLNGHDDYFLDSATGDLYTYSKNTDEWIPKANVGLHYRRDAMEYQSIGRFVVKSPTYRPKQPALHNMCEMLCTIKKQFLHHWLFKDVDYEFQVNLTNSWDIHPITFTNPEKKYNSLAENNQRGPLILECENIIGLMFEIESNKKDTVKLLKNFIENGIKIIKFSNHYNLNSITNERQFNQNRGVDSIELVFQSKTKVNNNGNPEELKKQQQKSFMIEYRKLLNKAIQETERDKIFHVGFSVKKDRLPDFVQHNNIAEKHLKVKQNKSSSRNPLTETLHSTKKITEQEFLDMIPSTAGSKTRINRKTTSHRNTNHDILTEDLEQIKPNILLTQAYVRRTLHPSLEEEYLGDTKIWIPGYLKSRSRKEQMQIQTDRQIRSSLLNDRNYTDHVLE